MRSRTAKPILALILTLSAPAFAQDGTEGQVIDLFDGQSEMEAAPIRVESTDGAVVVDSVTDGDDATGSMDGGFTLRYEQRQSSILVPATVEGKSVYFIFDTGATFTTLDAKFARGAGLTPASDAPSVRLRTANGEIDAKLGIINSLILGGRSHAGVTFSMCEDCPSGVYKNKPIVGLLGMNVIGRYRTSFDHSKGVIEMSPTGAYSDRSSDIKYWMQVRFRSVALHANGRHRVIHGIVENRARRSIKQVTIRASCSGGSEATTKLKVAGGKSKKFSVVIKDGNCSTGLDRSVADARW